MNIFLFNGVPFTNEYKNVYSNQKTLLDELIDNNYLLAEVSDIAKYNIITSTLVVPKEYINCNYVAITSLENGVLKTFYYFVINVDISSTSSITLMLEKDAFHSYYNAIEIKNSKVIQTNLMHQLYQPSNYTIPSDKLICGTTPIHRTLLHQATPEWTLIAVVAISDAFIQAGYNLTNKHIIFRSGSYLDMQYYRNLLMIQKFTTTNEPISPTTNFYTFQIYELYVIPYSNCIDYDGSQDIYIPVEYAIDTYTSISFHRPLANQTIHVLNETTIHLSPVYKYAIGTKSTNVVIDGNGENITFRTQLYIDSYGSVNITLVYGENLLDITNDLKVDVYTSEYYLWKNQNANQLKAQNATNYINGAISLASSVVGLGVGVGTGSVNGIASGTLGVAKSITDMATTSMNRKAVLKDAKQKLPSRNDITSANSMYIYQYGIYVEQYEPVNIDDIFDDINWYGFLFTTYDNQIKTHINDMIQLHTYINIQCDDVNIVCNDCDVQSLNTIKDIFNNGVRIWASCNKETILKQIEQVNTSTTENAV